MRSKGINWKTLSYLPHIAEYGSFLEAAEHLNCSQAHLSIKTLQLEKTLGFTLFQRTDRGVLPTRKGQEFLALVTPFMNQLQRISRMGAHEDGLRTIRMVAPPTVMSYILLEPLMQYQRQTPDIRFDLIEDDTHLNLIRHDADIVVRPALEHALPDMTQAPLFILTKKLYASQSYVDKYGKPQSVEELSQHRLISTSKPRTYMQTDREWILKVGMPSGQKRTVYHRNSSFECNVSMAKNGMGIIAGYPLMSLIRDADFINILPHISAEPVVNYLVYPISSGEDESLISLIAFLQDYFTSDLQRQ